MSSELAKQSTLPAYMQKYARPTADVSQFGHIDAADIGINMLKLGQSNSREVKRAGWGVTGQEPQIPMGGMFLSKDGRVIAPGTNFIPLIRTVKFIRWIGKPGDGRIDFMTDDPNDERIVKIDGLAFKKDEHTGDTVAPLVTKYINFYVMLQTFDMPVLMSFKRTSIPEGKALTQSVIMATQQNENIPMFLLMFSLGQPKIVRDGPNDWFSLTFAPAGFAPEQAIPKAEKMAELAKNLSRFASEREFEAIEAGSVEREHETKQAQGKVVDATATVVSANGHQTPQAPQAPAAPVAPPAPPPMVATPVAVTQTMTPGPLPTQQQVTAPAQPAPQAPSGVKPLW